MIQQMFVFLLSLFANPSILGIGLAVVFGAIWLFFYKPPLFREPWLWAILVGSAVLMPISVVFAEVPLRIWVWQAYTYFWSVETLSSWLLFINVPALFLNALVNEGGKLIPVVIYWWRKGKNITPALGLAAGAMAGAGFGILWVQWLYNFIVVSGGAWEIVHSGGIVQFIPWLEGFFVIAFHIASCALAGYGLARGWGWQYYLLASFSHTILSYVYLLQHAELISAFQALMGVGALALVVTGVVFWLRERKSVSVAKAQSRG